MSKYYREYVWREGIPYGIGEVAREPKVTSYKIPMDPYRKRIAIERYCGEVFESLIYDSALLDFRHLKPAEQSAWQKVILSDSGQQMVAAIYNHDDRLILIETYCFEQRLCRSCISTSGHGIKLSEQKIYYKALGDAFNGVILFDSHSHPVMCKRYACDEPAGEFSEFTDLLEELWDGERILVI